MWCQLQIQKRHYIYVLSVVQRMWYYVPVKHYSAHEGKMVPGSQKECNNKEKNENEIQMFKNLLQRVGNVTPINK